MILPNVPNDFLDKGRNVLYRFMAYRRLDPPELKKLALTLLSTMKRKPKRNTTVIIITNKH